MRHSNGAKITHELGGSKRENKVMNFLVTGGAGFIGSNLVERLLGRGDSVRILDNFSTGKRENISGFEGDVKVIEGDIRDIETVQRAMKGVDFCLHHAAVTSVTRSIENPIDTSEVNIEGTLKVLLSAKELGGVKVVYAGSASVYGNNPVLPRREDLIPEPVSPYAVSKFSGECYCRMFYKTFSIPVVILRYFNVFGKRQRENSPYSAVIPKFIQAMREGEKPIIYGDGSQTRDFTHVENVVNAVLLACEKDEANGEIFNIACGKKVSINELLNCLSKLMEVETKPCYAEEKPGDVKHSVADISKASRVLGYKPETGLEEGLKKTLGAKR